MPKKTYTIPEMVALIDQALAENEAVRKEGGW